MSTDPRQPEPLDRMLRLAVRRVRLAAAIDGLAGGLRAGGIAALVVLAVDRIARLGLPPATAAGIVGAGALIGLVPAMRRRIDPVRVASRLDAALGLRDRLGTAAALAGGGTAVAGPRHDPAFAGLVRRDASAAARGLDPRAALPLNVPRSAAHAAVLLVVLVLGWIFVPEIPKSPEPEPSATTAMATLDPTEQEELARTLAEAAERFGENGEPLATPNEAGEAQVRDRGDEIARTLDDLARQLAPDEDDAATDAGERDATEIRDEAVRELTDAAGELEQQARRDEQVLDELTDRFSGLQSPASAEQDEQIGRLAEALRRGAFDEAADALDEIARNGGEPGGDPEAARRRAEALRSLAEQAAARARAAEREAEAAAEEQRRRLNEAVDELTGEAPPQDATEPEPQPESEPEPPLDPEEIRRRLEEAGADPELTERLVDEAERLQEQQQLDEAIRRDAESVERSLEDAAEQLAPPSPDTPADPTTPTPEPGPPSPPDGAPGGEQQQPPSQSEQGGEQQQQTPGGQSGEQQQQQTPGGQSGEQQQQQTPGGQGGEQQQQQSPGGQSGEQQQSPGGQGGEQQQQTPGGQGGEQQQQTPGGQGGEQQQQQTPGGQSGEQQQSPGGQGGEQQQQSPGGQGGEQQQTPGGQGGEQKQQTTGGQSGEKQQQQTPGGQGGEQQQQTPGGQGGEQQQQTPGGQGGEQQPPQPSEGDGPGGDAAGSQPGRGLRELAERRQQAEDARRRADEAREFARRVGSHLSPEEQRRFSERFASEPSGSGVRDAASDPRDISRAADGGESIAELPGTGDGPLTRPGSTSVRTRPADPEDAARTAERAVAERRIPGRYHEIIRRYFDRLRTTEGGGASGNAAGNTGP